MTKKRTYLLLCIGIILGLVLIVSLNYCSAPSSNTLEKPEVAQKETISTEKISGLNNLDFLSDEDKDNFISRLKDYTISIDKTWPVKITIFKLTNNLDNNIEFYFRYDTDNSYYACLYEKDKGDFAFYPKDDIQGITDEISVKKDEKSSSEKPKVEERPTQAETQPEVVQEAPAPQQKASNPVRIDNATALLNYVPKSQFSALPDIITQHLKQKGITANGHNTIIDIETISPTGNKVQFSGWITDTSGSKLNLTIEYNQTSAQFGIGINL